MPSSFTRLTAAAICIAAGLVATPASALLIDVEIEFEDTSHSDDLVYFYPYRTSYRQVDRRYAFDDDPLSAFTEEPLHWHVEVQHNSVRRGMSQPRTSFVPEMFKSTEGI